MNEKKFVIVFKVQNYQNLQIMNNAIPVTSLDEYKRGTQTTIHAICSLIASGYEKIPQCQNDDCVKWWTRYKNTENYCPKVVVSNY